MSLNREHSKAQRNPPCTKQQTKYVPIRVSYVSKQVCTYQVYACCVPFVFLEHGALSICKSPVCTKNVEPSTLFATSSVCHSNPCFIVSKRSGRNRCTDIQQHHYSSSMYEYVCCRWTASTAKHNCSSAITAAQSSIQPRTCRSEYVSKVRTYTLASSRLFSCSMELLAFASRLFAPKMLDHLLYICL